jgi:serine/threonine protein phosphatase 1
MGKTFAIGDIHGNFLALQQCITASQIDKQSDTLIVLGDVVDGWSDVKEVVEELLTFKNLIVIRGNHDAWFMNFMDTGYKNPMWTKQGGQATLDSYIGEAALMDKHSKQYFKKSVGYYIHENKYIFLHGGFDWHIDIDEQSIKSLMRDRHMYSTALQWEYTKSANDADSVQVFPNYEKIFIGHTTTEWMPSKKYKHDKHKPVFASNLINLDTGAGWSGKLTIMDIDSKEYWQSELAPKLYPNVKGRR